MELSIDKTQSIQQIKSKLRVFLKISRTVKMGFSFYKDMGWKELLLFSECLCGVLLQLMLLFALAKDPLKCFRNSAVYLVANLSVADLNVCVRSVMTIVLDPESKIMEYWDHSTIVASLLTVLSIAIDRYIMVSNPIKRRIFIGYKKMILWIALIWIVSFIESITQLIKNEEGSYDDLVRHSCNLLVVLGAFIFYIATFKHLTKQSRTLSQLQNNHSIEHRAQKSRILNEKRFLKTIIIIGTIAIITILPNAIFNEIQLFGGHTEENEGEDNPSIILFAIWTINFVINPVLYVWRLPKYRKTFCIIYCCRT